MINQIYINKVKEFWKVFQLIYFYSMRISWHIEVECIIKNQVL